MDLPKRKFNWLEQFDYSSCGAYFITVCTKNHRNLFWENVGATIGRPQDIKLSDYGCIVDDAIKNIPSIYPMIMVDKYVIMPNHIHLILTILCDEHGRPMVAPTISNVISQMKGYVSKKIGFSVWQKLFHDHIIRNEYDYNEVWQYIENNPQKWNEDHLFLSR